MFKVYELSAGRFQPSQTNGTPMCDTEAVAGISCLTFKHFMLNGQREIT